MHHGLWAFVTSILMAGGVLAQPSSASGLAAQDQVSSRLVAKALAAGLEANDVYPAQGARYAAALQANAEAGIYDALKGVELAQRLEADLQSLARDGHLRVMLRGEGGGRGPRIVMKAPADAAGGPVPSGRGPMIVRRALPPEIEHAGWIAPGIAFVRFNLFSGSPGVLQAVSQFMATHADAKAVIFDLRTHMGGGLEEMDLIFPWLFDKPTRLVTMATRKSVDQAGASPIADVPSLRVVEADPEFVTREHWVTPHEDRRLNKAKVYLLTSGFSASAAEHFALAFKHTGRATLIGRTTAGANHFGAEQPLGGQYTAFVPVGRTFDPTTGKDWEGVGIAPDIDISPEDALVKALTLENVPSDQAARLSARVAPELPLSR